MATEFKTASRSMEQMVIAKQEIDDIFAAVKGKDGRINPKGLRELSENKFEIAEVLIQLIQDEVAFTDPTPFLVDQRDGVLGDDFVWQEISSVLRVVSRSPGSRPHSQRLTFREYGLTTSQFEIGVDVPLEKIATGRITASMVVEQMAEAINRRRVAMVLSGLDAGVPSSNDRSGVAGFTLRYAALTLANLDNAVDGLLDEAGKCTIFGRQVALSGIRNFANWSDFSLTEFEHRGQIGQYRGQPVVTLVDRTSQRVQSHLISAKKVYLVGEQVSSQPGTILVTKDLGFLGYAEVDAKAAVFTTGIRLEDGLLVRDAYQYRIITLP